MINNNSAKQEQITFFEIFMFACLGYTILTICTIFFEEDLFRILTFFTPLFWLFVFSGYVVFAAASFLYIPFQIKRLAWRSFGPVIINSITFLIVYFFYDSLKDLRIDILFQVNMNRFDQAAQWVTQSIADGNIKLDNGGGNIILPREYQGLADDGTVYVTHEYGVISILFDRGGGMFEYGPSFLYRSDNIAARFHYSDDITCNRWLSPKWYDCY